MGLLTGATIGVIVGAIVGAIAGCIFTGTDLPDVGDWMRSLQMIEVRISRVSTAQLGPKYVIELVCPLGVGRNHLCV